MLKTPEYYKVKILMYRYEVIKNAQEVYISCVKRKDYN